MRWIIVDRHALTGGIATDNLLGVFRRTGAHERPELPGIRRIVVVAGAVGKTDLGAIGRVFTFAAIVITAPFGFLDDFGADDLALYGRPRSARLEVAALD